ncbi:MAG: hypothetical protein GXP16_15140 [Gammaproteobacteria bacterium]|nr:hypothetical protein [Gammaproteobacteria bacterium]
MASVVVKASLMSLILWVLSPLAVAAPPFVANPPADVDINEDAVGVSISFVGVFDDPDIPFGDSLTLEVEEFSHPAITSASMTGAMLNITLAPNANGSGTVTVEAEDTDEDTVSAIVTINVLSVNDQPVVVGTVPSFAMLEDASDSVSLAGVFDDVDIATNGDSLGYSVVGSTNPAIDTAAMVGDQLSITLLPNQFGSGAVDVRATDGDGLFVEVSVSVTVSAENDPPFVANAIPSACLPWKTMRPCWLM